MKCILQHVRSRAPFPNDHDQKNKKMHEVCRYTMMSRKLTRLDARLVLGKLVECRVIAVVKRQDRFRRLGWTRKAHAGTGTTSLHWVLQTAKCFFRRRRRQLYFVSLSMCLLLFTSAKISAGHQTKVSCCESGLLRLGKRLSRCLYTKCLSIEARFE